MPNFVVELKITGLECLAEAVRLLCIKQNPTQPITQQPLPQQQAPAQSPAVPQQQASVTPPQAPPPVAPTVPTAAPKTFTVQDLQQAAAPLAQAGKTEQLRELLKKYGVKALYNLTPEQCGAFATDMRALGASI